MTLFSLLLILVEFPGLFPFLQYNFNEYPPSPPPPPLSIINWIPRGVFYIFLAIICFEQNIVVRMNDEKRHASTSSRFFDGIFIVISAWCMMLLGVIYILLGMFCIQKVMERVRRDEKEKWKEYYEKVHEMELHLEEEEEREWLLENGDEVAERRHNPATRWQRWRRRCKRRRLRGHGGICYQLGCRTVDWKC